MAGHDAENLAIQALLFLAQDQERLDRFMRVTGLEVSNLRASAAQPGFLGAVLDYLMQDESLLLSFAAGEHLAPETVAKAARRLAPANAQREGGWQDSW